jgi:hypothetical protein
MDDLDSCGCCPIVAKGGVSLGGGSEIHSTKSFESDGFIILVNNEAVPSIFGNKLTIKQKIEWGTLAKFQKEVQFVWDSGLSPLRWYQVQTCCEFPTAAGSGLAEDPQPGGCDVIGIETDHEKCIGATGKQFLLQTILARNVKGVCESLTQQRLNWRICSIKRWSRPADPLLVANDDFCNTLLEVPYRDIPECMFLSLFVDGITRVGVKTLLFEYPINGGPYSVVGSVCTGSGDPECSIRLFNGATFAISTGPLPVVGFFDVDIDDPWVDPQPPPLHGYILMGGEAIVSYEATDNELTEIGVKTILELEQLNFIETDDSLPRVVLLPTFTTTSCGSCTNMPTLIYLHHNISNQGVFYNFLNRNGFEMPNPLPMRYNYNTNGWTGNFQLKGFGGDNTIIDESWRFVFEWSCTNVIRGENLSNSSFKFSMLAVRKFTKSEQNTVDYDTRLMIVFPPEELCARTKSFEFDFPFKFNTETQYVSNQYSIGVDSVLFLDKILLFFSDYWYNNPDLILRLSQSDVLYSVPRQDIRPIFPVA